MFEGVKNWWYSMQCERSQKRIDRLEQLTLDLASELKTGDDPAMRVRYISSLDRLDSERLKYRGLARKRAILLFGFYSRAER